MDWWYCVYVFVDLFFVTFLGKDTYYVKKLLQVEKMNQSGFNDEILRITGGKAKNNLNEI